MIPRCFDPSQFRLRMMSNIFWWISSYSSSTVTPTDSWQSSHHIWRSDPSVDPFQCPSASVAPAGANAPVPRRRMLMTHCCTLHSGIIGVMPTDSQMGLSRMDPDSAPLRSDQSLESLCCRKKTCVVPLGGCALELNGILRPHHVVAQQYSCRKIHYYTHVFTGELP